MDSSLRWNDDLFLARMEVIHARHQTL